MKAVFRSFGSGFFSGSGLDFFPESGSRSGSAKNPDPIGKIRIRIHEKKVQELKKQEEKNFFFIFITLNTVLFGQVPPKPYQENITVFR